MQNVEEGHHVRRFDIRYYKPREDEAIILARWRGSFNEPATVLNWFKTG